MVELRPYQIEGVEEIVTALKAKRFALLQAATGAGKTIMFSELIRRWALKYDMRIGIMVHRLELVKQAADKLAFVWPEAPIGIACASIDSRVDMNSQITIGTVQTLARRLEKANAFDLLIIDEAHRLPPKNHKSQYRTFIRMAESLYPDLRVLGVTATPYRLGHGWICGDWCKKENKNWFDRLDYKISISNLQDQGFLCGMRAKGVTNNQFASDLKAVHISGEYNLGQLSNIMSKEVHINTAVDAYKEYGEGRTRAMIFAVTIRHAEFLRVAFSNAGYKVGCIHSKMHKDDRNKVMADFRAGNIQFITNVGVLTEGVDVPEVDLIMLCRPTMSPALYVQMIGRGTRTAEDKNDCLVLDLADNCQRHGHWDEPFVLIPTEKRMDHSVTTIRMKKCPNCSAMVNPGIMTCPDCRYEWPQPDLREAKKAPEMKELFTNRKQDPVKTARILSYTITGTRSRAGNSMVTISMNCRLLLGNTQVGSQFEVNEFLVYSTSAIHYARNKWCKITGSERRSLAPTSTTDALNRKHEIVKSMPTFIGVRKEGKYWKVVSWNVDPPEDTEYIDKPEYLEGQQSMFGLTFGRR